MMQEQMQQIFPFLGEIASDKGNEIIPKYCPFCKGGQHRDKNTFSINRTTGAYNCLRGSCGEKGNIYRLAKYLGVEIMTKETYFRESKPQKIYKKPDNNFQELSVDTINYFKSRMISEKTLRDNQVETDNHGNIVFKYYLNGDLVFVKYKLPREPSKGESKSWREKDTRPILYGMDKCLLGEPLIIVEGEPDKLTLDEVGIRNAVSIPSGTQDFSWVENCWEFMEQYHDIVIWADNDIAGRGFQQEAISRLNDWKIKVVQSDFKDANEMLKQVAKEKGVENAKHEIRKVIDEALTIKKEFITNLAAVRRKDHRHEIAISSGYEELDDLIGGWYGGQLVIWTGYNGSGKSTILSNVLLNAIEKGHRTFVYSGELTKEDFKEWMDLQLSGKKHLSSYYCPVKRQEIPTPNPRYYSYLDKFYDEKIYLFDTEDYATDEKIISAMEYMAKREGIKVFAIDNMLTMNISGVGGDLNEKQGKLILKLKSFARIFNAVVHLVAHPRKPSPGQSRVDKYSISGTANITDLADRVIGFHRLTPTERMKAEYAGFNNVLTIFKDRKFGVYDQEILFYFDYFSKRYYTNDIEKTKEYSWVKLISKEDRSHEAMQEVRGKDIPL
ncbi:MAG: DnaB-like helicase C-terminal domain-containing protein [Eubacteriales bacterium]|nr:DnaB-like helicase C-terminal domain-containing protein [Eubacteriales bacterium]